MSAAILREDADNSVNMLMISLVSIYQWDCFMKGLQTAGERQAIGGFKIPIPGVDADVSDQISTEYHLVARSAGQGKVRQRPRVCQAAENLAHDIVGETLHDDVNAAPMLYVPAGECTAAEFAKKSKYRPWTTSSSGLVGAALTNHPARLQHGRPERGESEAE